MNEWKRAYQSAGKAQGLDERTTITSLFEGIDEREAVAGEIRVREGETHRVEGRFASRALDIGVVQQSLAEEAFRLVRQAVPGRAGVHLDVALSWLGMLLMRKSVMDVSQFDIVDIELR
jgi:hypothetical protein